MTQICSGFSKEDWHPESVHGILLCFALITMGCRIFRGCDAAIELRGKLLPSGRPQPIALKCWFSVGTIQAYSIRQIRKVFSDAHGKIQLLSTTPTSLQDLSPFNLYKDNSTVSGNLNDSVIFTIPGATCLDAGVYTCEFHYRAVVGSFFEDKIDAEHRRLDMFPTVLRCVATPGGVDFSRLPPNPVFLRIHCRIKSTVELRWVWETKKASNRTPWTVINDRYVSSNEPEEHERCKISWGTTMLFRVSPGDRNRKFRVFVVFKEGRSNAATFTLKDWKGKKFKPLQVDELSHFQKILTITGWALLVLVLFIVIFLLVAHALYPGLSEPSPLERLRRQRQSGMARLREICRCRCRCCRRQRAEGNVPGGQQATDTLQQQGQQDPGLIGGYDSTLATIHPLSRQGSDMVGSVDPVLGNQQMEVNMEDLDIMGAEDTLADSRGTFSFFQSGTMGGLPESQMDAGGASLASQRLGSDKISVGCVSRISGIGASPRHSPGQTRSGNTNSQRPALEAPRGLPNTTIQEERAAQEEVGRE